MKFAVDCMLGKLARWLRILGFDTLYFRSIQDSALLQIAREEDRILLTRDRGLFQRTGRQQSLFISSEKWRSQLEQVLKSFDLKKEISVFSRCPECNQTLKFLSRSEARNLAPLHVLETASRFSLCPGCSRVFWKGSHQKRMQSMIEQILGKEYNEYP